MKFTIPFNMSAFLDACRNPGTLELGAFVWGYRVKSPLVFIGIYKASHNIGGHACYTIDLLDGSHIDVDGMVKIPDQFLPYVVARDNKVHRVQLVGSSTLTTTHGHVLKVDEVQPVLYYRICDEAKVPSEMVKACSEPDLPNRVREEGV